MVQGSRVKGRHVGDGFGGTPTNRPVDFGGLVIARVRDGKIAEGWNCFDFLGMYQQIGWVNNPPAPPIEMKAAARKRASKVSSKKISKTNDRKKRSVKRRR